MRAVLVAAATLVALGACGVDDSRQRGEQLRDGTDDAARAALAVLAEEVTPAAGEEVSGLADTQEETCDGNATARHRVDAELELAAGPPAGLEQRVRAVVPEDLEVVYALDASTLQVGVVSGCVELGPVRALELALEPRYRVRP